MRSNGIRILLATLFCCFTLITAFPASSALANDGSFGGKGGDLKPMDNQDVVMEQELVQIWLKGRGYQVRSEYIFRNDGPAQTVKMGFPSTVHMDPSSDGSELFEFEVRVEGVALPNQISRATDPQTEREIDWYVHEVPFAAGERKGVATEYVQYYSGGVYWETVEYAFRTGASWKDKVGRVDLRIYKTDQYQEQEEQPPKSESKPRRLFDTDLGWRLIMTDIEPTAETDLSMSLWRGEPTMGNTDTREEPKELHRESVLAPPAASILEPLAPPPGPAEDDPDKAFHSPPGTWGGAATKLAPPAPSTPEPISLPPAQEDSTNDPADGVTPASEASPDTASVEPSSLSLLQIIGAALIVLGAGFSVTMFTRKRTKS